MVREKSSLVLKVNKPSKRLWIVFASIFTFLTLIFTPVSFASPPTHTQTVSSPARLWLMSPEDDERCRQDTERYNAAWTAAWYASHPGQGPAPAPYPPYVCPPPPPDNTHAPATQTPVTPNKPIVPGTNQGTGLPNELENNPGNTPELNTGLGKPGEYKPGYDPATGLPVNEAGQAAPNQPAYDVNNPLAPQPMQTPEPFRPDLQTPAPDPNAPHKYIVPPAEEPHLPQATLPTQHAKPPTPHKPEIIPDKPADNGSLNPVQKQPAKKIAPKEQKPPAKSGKQARPRPCVRILDHYPNGAPRPSFGKSGPHKGNGGIPATDLMYPQRVSGQLVAQPGDTFTGQPSAPGVPGDKGVEGRMSQSTGFVRINSDGTRKLGPNGKPLPPITKGVPTPKSKIFDYARDNMHYGDSRTLPGGTVEVNGKSYTMITPMKTGLDPAGAGRLFATTMGADGKSVHMRPIPLKDAGDKNMSQISGFTKDGYVYITMNNIRRKGGQTTMYRVPVKDFEDPSKWEPKIPGPIDGLYGPPGTPAPFIPGMDGAGEMSFVKLRDGNVVLSYLDKHGNAQMKVISPGTDPGAIANPLTLPANITPPGLHQTYGPFVIDPKHSTINDIRMFISSWNTATGNNTYGVYRISVNPNGCKKGSL